MCCVVNVLQPGALFTPLLHHKSDTTVVQKCGKGLVNLPLSLHEQHSDMDSQRKLGLPDLLKNGEIIRILGPKMQACITNKLSNLK